MPNSALYLMTVLLWGSSWFAIKLQLGNVAPQVSVFYRFVLAAVILLLFCVIRNKPLRYRPADHLRFAFIGLFLFNLNFITIYYASITLTTGLISVIFSCVLIFNMVNGYIVLRDPVTPKMLLGALIGIVGIGLVFAPEISGLQWSDQAVRSIGLALIGTLFASIGMISSAYFQRQRYPVLQTNAWGMAWGAAWMLLYILIIDVEFNVDFNLTYIGSLLWLSIFASVLAFSFFLTLVGRIGAARASYAMVIFPIVALIISTVLEGYQWTWIAFAGIVLAISGNIIILLDKSRTTRGKSGSSGHNSHCE